VLAAVCTASATIALLHPSTASELQHMLNLGFEVTSAQVTSLIIVGGGALLVLHWTIIAFVARRTWQRQAVPGLRKSVSSPVTRR
jgi:hypothetical protein